MVGNVESLLKKEQTKKGTLLFVLIDSEASELDAATELATNVEKMGADAILVGGSSIADQMEMNQVVSRLKESIQIPIIFSRQT